MNKDYMTMVDAIYYSRRFNKKKIVINQLGVKSYTEMQLKLIEKLIISILKDNGKIWILGFNKKVRKFDNKNNERIELIEKYKPGSIAKESPDFILFGNLTRRDQYEAAREAHCNNIPTAGYLNKYHYPEIVTYPLFKI